MSVHPVNQWVGAAIKRSRLKQAEIGRRLTKELRREIDRAAVNKMVKGTRDVAADEMLAMEGITGLPVPSPNVPIKVPLIDWVAAGKLAESRSQIPMEDVPLLAFADLGRGEFFALTVKGTSMDRVSPDGSVIVVNRADKILVTGAYYVFWTSEEGATYKRWPNADPPYLEPYTWDGVHKPIFVKKKRGMEVVGRVRRTVLDL